MFLVAAPERLSIAGLDIAMLRIGSGRPAVLVGFAAETEHVVARATEKLRAKRADLIVANDVSRHDAGFGVDTNEVTLVTANGAEAVSLQSKTRIAAIILDRVEQLLLPKTPTAGRPKPQAQSL